MKYSTDYSKPSLPNTNPQNTGLPSASINVNLMDLFTQGVWLVAADRKVTASSWDFKFSKTVLDGLDIGKLNGKLVNRYRIDQTGTAYFEYALPEKVETKATDKTEIEG